MTHICIKLCYVNVVLVIVISQFRSSVDLIIDEYETMILRLSI